MSSAPNAKFNADSHLAATGGRILDVAGILTLAALAAYWKSFSVPFLLECQPAPILWASHWRKFAEISG